MSQRFLLRSRDFPTALSEYGPVMTIPLSERLGVGRSVSAIRVNRAVVPNLFYTILEGDNDRLDFVFPLPVGDAIDVTIPPGNYDGDALISAITSGFADAASAHPSPVVQGLTLTMTTSATQQVTVAVTDSGGNPVIFAFTSDPYNHVSTPILDLLGFELDGFGDPNNVTDAIITITNPAGDSCSFSNISSPNHTWPNRTITLAAGTYSTTDILEHIKSEINPPIPTDPELTVVYTFNPPYYGISFTIIDHLGSQVQFALQEFFPQTLIDDLGIDSADYIGVVGYEMTSNRAIVTTVVPKYSGASTYTGESPMNVYIDRMIAITCDEVRGRATQIDTYGTAEQLEGTIAVLSANTIYGGLIEYRTTEEEPFTRLTDKQPIESLTLRLARYDHASLGPTRIDYIVEIEVR